MNAKSAHQYLSLVQALANGKTIQYRHSTKGWLDSNEMHFDVMPECYRIKPEPRTFEIVRSKLSCGSIYDAETWDGSNPEMWERITVQEVLQ